MSTAAQFISSDQETIFETHEEYQENVTAARAKQEVVDENLVQSSLNPPEAFQYFHQMSGPLEGRHYYQLNTNSQSSQIESPWEKFYRLQSELEELKLNLNSIEVVESEKKHSIWSLLQDKTETLLQETNALSSHSAWKYVPKEKNTAALDNTPSDILQDLLQKFSNISDEKMESKVEIITSLFHTVSQNYSKRLLSLEKKISYLETLLGVELNENNVLQQESFLKSSGQTVFPIVSTLNSLEQKVSLLDSSNLDQLRSKLLLFKTDIDNLTSTISSEVTLKNPETNDSQQMKLVDIYQKITNFIDQFSFVQSVVHEIPVIILRLKTLENIHWNASMFKTRLETLETDILSVSNDLNSNKQVLTELKQTLSENFLTMKNNIEKLEIKLQS